MTNFADRTIWTGDNLDILRGLNSGSIDLVYLDPPFNSNRNYAAPLGSAAVGDGVGAGYVAGGLGAGPPEGWMGRRGRCGCGRGGGVVASIGCSLFWGRFSVSKPLSQKHGSTFLPLQDADPTPSFGGFGVRFAARPPMTMESTPSTNNADGEVSDETNRTIPHQICTPASLFRAGHPREK